MGNPTSYLRKTLTWEGKQPTQLSMTIAGANVSLNYDYDENGLRMQKQYSVFGATNTMSYYYNGSVLIGMETEQGAIMRFSYDAGGNVGSVDYSDDDGDTFTTYYYLRNAQGDIVKLIDGSGNTVVEYTYDSWGRIIATTGSLANTVGANQPFRYRGYVYDAETGWYYLRSRYYDPTTCRFISADVLLSTGQGVIGHNSFAYCGNNPIVRIDSEGTLFFTLLCAAVGVVLVTAVSCGIIGGIEEEHNGGSFGDGFVSHAAGGAVAAIPAAANILTCGSLTPVLPQLTALSSGIGSITSYGISCAMKHEEFSIPIAIENGVLGAGCGWLGGKIMGNFPSATMFHGADYVIAEGVIAQTATMAGESFALGASTLAAPLNKKAALAIERFKTKRFYYHHMGGHHMQTVNMVM